MQRYHQHVTFNVLYIPPTHKHTNEATINTTANTQTKLQLHARTTQKILGSRRHAPPLHLQPQVGAGASYLPNDAFIHALSLRPKTSGPYGLKTSRPRGLGTSGLQDFWTSGLRGLRTSRPQGLRTSGPRGLRTSGPRGFRTSGPRGLRTLGPHGLKPAGPRGLRTLGPQGYVNINIYKWIYIYIYACT